MKNIGMFYGNKNTAIEAYRKHSQSANWMAREFCTVTCNPREMTITYDDRIRYMYFGFDMEGDAQARIAGITFEAVFSEDLHAGDKQYVMTRFRPRVS